MVILREIVKLSSFDNMVLFTQHQGRQTKWHDALKATSVNCVNLNSTNL